jgi:DNA/RNA-binding domain of Phe-tRNA-synthetase-like protein
MIQLDKDLALADLVTLGVVAFDGLRVAERDDGLAETMARAVERIRAMPPPESTIAAVRTMYRRLGLDPTKVRPSSEALLRRVRRGDALPQINVLVDVCNWCSLECQLPYGLYDRDRIHGPIVFRMGRPGEQYAGIRKDVVHVAERPVLADQLGPFGNPTADSARTMITPQTTRALVVVFAPRPLDRALVEQAVEQTAARVLQYVGGREVGRTLL